MIDRRVFLKGIIGTGLSVDLLSRSKITNNKYAREEYVCGLQMPEVVLVVKVHEVITHHEPREYDVCGRCLIAFDSVPVEVRFFISGEDRNTPMPSDFKPGSGKC